MSMMFITQMIRTQCTRRQFVTVNVFNYPIDNGDRKKIYVSLKPRAPPKSYTTPRQTGS